VGLRIGITGSHGTGKTTLSKELSKVLGLPQLPEVSRGLKEEGFEILTEGSEPNTRSQFAIIGMQLYTEQKLDNFVSDRTLIDCYAYTRYFTDLDWGSYKNYSSLHDFVLRYSADFYDYIFYVPIEFTLTTDGLRSANVKIQKDIDDIIFLSLSFLSNEIRYGKEYYTLTGSVEERLAYAIEIIK